MKFPLHGLLGLLSLGVAACQSSRVAEPSRDENPAAHSSSAAAGSLTKAPPDIYTLGSAVEFRAQWVEFALNESGSMTSRVSREEGDRVVAEWEAAARENRPQRPPNPPLRTVRHSSDRLSLTPSQMQTLLSSAAPSTSTASMPPPGALCVWISPAGEINWATVEEQGATPELRRSPAGVGMPATCGRFEFDRSTKRRKSTYTAEPAYPPGHPLFGQSKRAGYRGGVLEISEMEGYVGELRFRGGRSNANDTQVLASVDSSGAILMWCAPIE